MKKKQIQCPICRKRLIDADPKTKTVLITPKDVKNGLKADYFMKCTKCGTEVGIKKLQG